MTNKKNNKKEGLKIIGGNAGVPINSEPIEITPGNHRANLNVNNMTITKPVNLFQNISYEENNSQGFTKTVEGWNISDDGVIIKTSTYKGDNVSEALVFVKGHKVEDGKLIKIEHTAK